MTELEKDPVGGPPSWPGNLPTGCRSRATHQGSREWSAWLILDRIGGVGEGVGGMEMLLSQVVEGDGDDNPGVLEKKTNYVICPEVLGKQVTARPAVC